ncbi:hypothetical protein [Albimonas pacifica]|uniref:O-Antigen ligase n=1 Tax=Albimonas pacifica TaxID=1114924 RepID=A0A1I3IKC1_9RHOB|nr:hypothetical protein [Albimonas pacifica]SFI48416.1 hypothetical protein SAMN05216258_107106 [Albimonas pacifica]
MPNLVAQIVLLAWPALTVLLFLRLPASKAIVATILLGLMVLPTRGGFDLPLLPPLDRFTAPVLSALLCCVLAVGMAKTSGRGGAAPAAPLHRPGWLPDSPLQRVLIAVMLLQPVATAATNGEAVVYGQKVLPGLSLYDAAAVTLETAIALVPMLLGRRYLSRPEDVDMLMRFMVGALLIYTIPILYEVRMSPQIHFMVYGFRPSDFIQALRGGGYRPLVLMNHGLALATLMALAIVAAASLASVAAPLKKGLAWAKAVWLTLVLLLMNSLGAVFLAAAAAPFAGFARRPLQATVAAALAAMVLLYPLSRAYDLFPTQQIVSAIGGQRAASLDYRFRNEDILLDKAIEKPIFGWGGWARNRVFHPETGRDMSVTDGTWIISLGVGGIVGFISRFGLLVAPLFMLWRLRNRPDLGAQTTGLALVLAINLVDLLPNSSQWPLTWLIVGVLTGQAETLRAAAPAAAAAARRMTPRRRGQPPPRPDPDAPAPAPAGPAPLRRRGPPAEAEPEAAVRRGAVRPGLGGMAGRRGATPPRRG